VKPQQPNILFITSDQQRADCFGFEGRRVRTPHLDAMAAAGTRFSACITPNVVCQPSRASMLTGLLPRTHGAHDNGIDLPVSTGERGFAGQLSAAGYHTGFLGKAHFTTHNTFAPTGTPECRFSSADYPKGWRGPYMGFEHFESMVVGHNLDRMTFTPTGLAYEDFLDYDRRGAERIAQWKTQLEPKTDAAQTWHSALPPALHHSTWVSDCTVRFLQANQDRPFCAWASFPDPHHPFDAPEPWSRLHHPDDVDLPEHRSKDLERRPWWHRAALEGVPDMQDEDLRKQRMQYSRMPDQNDRQLRDIIANYYGMISLIDHNVGRIMIALDELGLSDNTLVVYSTDHGDWLGDHGLLLKGPMHYEGLLRVGCLLKGPGVPPGKVVADPVSTLDLPATFLDYAGVAPAHDWHSRSLRPLIEGTASRDFAYNEWKLLASRSGVALDLRTVRTASHKLTLELDSGAGELYDLVNDPHELDNLYGDAAARVVQAELTDMIHSRPDDACQTPMVQVGMA
jgi:arylsulfatase A-like enzyme